MSNGGSINTGGSGGGGGSGVGSIGGLVSVIQSLSKKKKKPFDPFSTAGQTLRTQEMIGTVERAIAEDLRLGNPVSEAKFKRLAQLEENLKRQERKFEKQSNKFTRAFARAGLTGLTLGQVVEFLSMTSRGQRIIGKFGSPIFNPAPLPGIGGTSTVPFVVTPAASTTSSFGGFGDLIGGAIDFGRNLLGDFFSPERRAELQPGLNAPRQAGFPLVPFVAPALRAGRALLPGLGLGAIGGEAADAFQRFINSGGASSLDENAAFTDAVPGSCRPKAHVKVNPCTGKGVWFTPRGRPLVFSGDLSACKRVDRVTKRLTKAMPRKHHHHRKSAKR